MSILNKKGFTLIELLAVIAILGIITVIAGASIVNTMSDAKGDIDAIQENSLISTAKIYFQDNFYDTTNYEFSYTTDDSDINTYIICIQNDLVGDNYFDEVTDKKNNPITGIIYLKDVNGDQSKLEATVDTTVAETNCSKL